MIIERDGKKYELTGTEIVRAFEEHLRTVFEYQAVTYIDGIDEVVKWRDQNEDEYDEMLHEIVDAMMWSFECYETMPDAETAVYDAIEDHGIEIE